jgi:hypothetical protein
VAKAKAIEGRAGGSKTTTATREAHSKDETLSYHPSEGLGEKEAKAMAKREWSEEFVTRQEQKGGKVAEHNINRHLGVLRNCEIMKLESLRI